jgi:hypothetical protein
MNSPGWPEVRYNYVFSQCNSMKGIFYVIKGPQLKFNFTDISFYLECSLGEPIRRKIA